MPDDKTDSEAANEEWAFIFNTLGEQTTRDMLLDIAGAVHGDDGERQIIEIRPEDGGAVTVLDITDHVEKMESEVTA